MKAQGGYVDNKQEGYGQNVGNIVLLQNEIEKCQISQYLGRRAFYTSFIEENKAVNKEEFFREGDRGLVLPFSVAPTLPTNWNTLFLASNERTLNMYSTVLTSVLYYLWNILELKLPIPIPSTGIPVLSSIPKTGISPPVFPVLGK